MSGAGIYVKTPSGLVAAATVPGKQGSQGPQSSLVPGTITTGAAGSSAAATITGPGPVQTLNLTIPRGDPGGWVASTGVVTGTDLNTMTTPGTYMFTSNGNNTTALNHPVDQWGGHLHVSGNSATFLTQIAYPFDNNGNVTSRGFFRTRTSATVWSTWRELVFKGTIGGGDLTGTGSPEGVIIAPVGTYYTDTAITNGAMRWVKKTGASNTGWKVVDGDTGWRSVSSLLTLGYTGTMLLRRVGDLVEFRAESLGCAAGAGTSPLTLPAGFTVATASSRGLLHTTTAVLRRYAITTTFSFPSGAPVGDTLFGAATYTTTDAWPTTLPGVAA